MQVCGGMLFKQGWVYNQLYSHDVKVMNTLIKQTGVIERLVFFLKKKKKTVWIVWPSLLEQLTFPLLSLVTCGETKTRSHTSLRTHLYPLQSQVITYVFKNKRVQTPRQTLWGGAQIWSTTEVAGELTFCLLLLWKCVKPQPIYPSSQQKVCGSCQVWTQAHLRPKPFFPVPQPVIWKFTVDIEAGKIRSWY